MKNAQERLAPQMHGYNLEIEDIYAFQQMCAYEVRSLCCPSQITLRSIYYQTVAIGYSKFCELFTEEEWEGFDYS